MKPPTTIFSKIVQSPKPPTDLITLFAQHLIFERWLKILSKSLQRSTVWVCHGSSRARVSFRVVFWLHSSHRKQKVERSALWDTACSYQNCSNANNKTTCHLWGEWNKPTENEIRRCPSSERVLNIWTFLWCPVEPKREARCHKLSSLATVWEAV